LDYLEVIGGGQPLLRPGAPFIAIPTTAGTGAEVTRNAVLGSQEHGVKASLRSPHLFPRAALVDPELTLGLPCEITAATGMDALTQLIEAAVSARANPMTDAFCEKGVCLAMRSLEKAFRNPQDLAAREDMSLAAMLSGMALANAGLGAVHGLAAPIGGMFAAPHGAVCAALLPAVWEANAKAIAERGTTEQQTRLQMVSRWIEGGGCGNDVSAGARLRQLCGKLNIKNLAQLGVASSRHDEIAAKALKASSMKANPVSLTEQELAGILRSS
jgi:alcohol dehydrogenase class IV